MLAGCSKHNSEPAHTFAYITNSGSNSVSVLDLATLKIVRTLATGNNPTGVTASPTKDEVYVVNTDSGTVSVIDTCKQPGRGQHQRGQEPLHHFRNQPTVSAGWVANAGSNTVTALDLDAHRVIGQVAVGEQPGIARVSGDGKFVAVANRGDDSVTLIDGTTMKVRGTLHVCRTPDSLVILPDASKAVVGCSGSHQVASVNLKNAARRGTTPVGGTRRRPGNEARRRRNLRFELRGADDLGSEPLHR